MRSLFTFLCTLFVCSATLLHGQYIYTFAGNGYGANTGLGGYTGDNGLARSAELNAPTGVTFDGAGNVYIADKDNNVVRKVNTSGIITRFAGTGTAGFSGDQGAATFAKLNAPYGVASDAHGNVYIADYNNNVIRKVNTAGMITTYAGAGLAGYSGDLGAATAAMLNGPTGIAVDTLGDLFIADTKNNVVREVSPAGIIFTIAGTGTAGYSGDGGFSTNAKLNQPMSVAVDPYNQLYIADYNNNVVRKVDTSNMITTFAGNGTPGHTGDGSPATQAQLRFPVGVSVFGFGNVYISDEGNNSVRMVNSAGVISTFAGIYTNGYTGDGGLANLAQLSSPKAIAADGLNWLYIADYDNNVIRVVTTETGIAPVTTNGSISIFPNPSSGSFTVSVPGGSAAAIVTVTDILGRGVTSLTMPALNADRKINIDNLPAGNYIVKVACGDNVYHEKVQVLQ